YRALFGLSPDLYREDRLDHRVNGPCPARISAVPPPAGPVGGARWRGRNRRLDWSLETFARDGLDAVARAVARIWPASGVQAAGAACRLSRLGVDLPCDSLLWLGCGGAGDRGVFSPRLSDAIGHGPGLVEGAFWRCQRGS